MMSHEGVDESEMFAFLNPSGSKIHGLVKSVAAFCAERRQSIKIRGPG
jgi:hypothetical protein